MKKIFNKHFENKIKVFTNGIIVVIIALCLLLYLRRWNIAEWNNFWNVTGSIIGVCSAYTIFRLQIKKDEKRSRDSELKRAISLINAFELQIGGLNSELTKIVLKAYGSLSLNSSNDQIDHVEIKISEFVLILNECFRFKIQLEDLGRELDSIAYVNDVNEEFNIQVRFFEESKKMDDFLIGMDVNSTIESIRLGSEDLFKLTSIISIGDFLDGIKKEFTDAIKGN